MFSSVTSHLTFSVVGESHTMMGDGTLGIWAHNSQAVCQGFMCSEHSITLLGGELGYVGFSLYYSANAMLRRPLSVMCIWDSKSHWSFNDTKNAGWALCSCHCHYECMQWAPIPWEISRYHLPYHPFAFSHHFSLPAISNHFSLPAISHHFSTSLIFNEEPTLAITGDAQSISVVSVKESQDIQQDKTTFLSSSSVAMVGNIALWRCQ